jgi:hypothetical protein
MRWVRQLIAQEPAAHRPQAGHERDLRPVRTCGPGGLPRVPAWPALPGLPTSSCLAVTLRLLRHRPGRSRSIDRGRCDLGEPR